MVFCALSLQFAYAAASWDGTKSIPKDGTVVKAVDISSQFVLAFSSAPTITGSGGTLAVYKGADLIKTIPIRTDNANVSVSGNNLVVKHGIASFDEGATYYIALLPGAVTLESPAVGVSIPSNTWDFVIADVTAPALIPVNADAGQPQPLVPVGVGTPANMSINGGAPAAFNLVMRFNEDVQKGSGKIAIYNAAGTVVEIVEVSTLAAGNLGKIITIPVAAAAKFVENTTYYVKVDKGAFADMSNADPTKANVFAGITTTTGWTFTTRDNSYPSITASVSNIGYNSAKLNVKISEAGTIYYAVNATGVAPAFPAGWTKVENVAANTQKVFDLNGLPQGDSYAMVISENTVGNITTTAQAEAAKIKFTTVDNIGPITYNGAILPVGAIAGSGRGQIITDKKTTGIYIYFDEEVVGGTGTLDVRKSSDQSYAFSIPASAVTSSKVNITSPAPDPWNGKWKAVVNFGGSLDSYTDYYVVFPEGFFKDKSGNAYVSSNNGGADHYVVPLYYNNWTFKSSDFVVPGVSFYTSDAGSTPKTTDITNAGESADIYIKFDESVLPTQNSSVWANVLTYSDWSKYVAFLDDKGNTVSATYSWDGVNNRIVINPDANLTYKATYTVVLRPNSVKDITGNSNVLTTEKRVNVTVGDNVVVAGTFGPTSNLGDYTPLTITFNKPVRAIKATDPFYEPLTTALVAPKITLRKEETAPGPVVTTTVIDPADYTVVYSNGKITVTPVDGKPFSIASAGGSTFRYELALAALVEDNAGNDLGAISHWYSFTDNVAPKITLVANTITKSTPLTITYSENVQEINALPLLADKIILKKDDANGDNVKINAVLAGKVITITPFGGGQFPAGKYYYGIGSVIEDLNGNDAPAGFKAITITDDTQPMYIVAEKFNLNGVEKTVKDTITNVTLNADGKLVFKITFDKAVHKKTVAPAVTDVATTLAAINAGDLAVVAGDVNDKILTVEFTPTVNPIVSVNDLGALSNLYTVTIPVNLVESNMLDPNFPTQFGQLKDPLVLNIKVKDAVKPTYTSTMLGAAGAVTNVALNGKFELVFDEKVTPVNGKQIVFTPAACAAEQTVSIASGVNVVASDATGTKWEIKHADFLNTNTVYTVTIPADAFKDATGNGVIASVAANSKFTTVVNAAPVLDAAATTKYPQDNADIVPLSLDLSVQFSEPILLANNVQPDRFRVYVVKNKGGANRASFDVNNDLINYNGVGANDSVVYSMQVNNSNNIIISGKTLTVKGVALAANTNYYVLITPNSFKDYGKQDCGDLPLYFAGITDPTVWNFSTKEVNAPTVAISYNRLGADGLPSVSSDIILTFNRPIRKVDDSPVTDADIRDAVNPIVKMIDVTNGNTDLAFTASINAAKDVITINNPSLVLLNEMQANRKYTVTVNPAATAAAKKVEGAAGGVQVAETTFTFRTTDTQKPTVPTVAFKTANEVADVYYHVDDKHVAKLAVTVSDFNLNDITGAYSEATDTSNNNITVRYFRSTQDLSVSSTEAWDLGSTTKYLWDDGSFDITYKNDGMTSGTKYYVYVVAKDFAGNLSDVAKFNFTTDDVVKPELVSKSASFDNDKNLIFTFNEPVKPVAGAKARIINQVTKETTYVNLIQYSAGSDAAFKAKTLITDGMNVPPTPVIANDVASYIVEIDPDMVEDVPRQVAAANVNAPNTWSGLTAIGSEAYIVSSVDKTAPTLLAAPKSSPLNIINASLNQVIGLKFSEAVKVKSSFVGYNVEYNNAGTWEPFDIISAANLTVIGDSIAITANRAFVSEKQYRLTVKDQTVEDLKGNGWNNGGDVVFTINVKDINPLAATFRLGATTLPQNNAFALPIGALTIDLNEAFYLNSTETYVPVNAYDLQSHVYLKEVNGSNVPFVATVAGNVITLGNIAADAFGKGKSYEFGYTNLYDGAASRNVNAGQKASFSVATDPTPVVVFVPGDNDANAATKTKIDVKPTLKVNFDGILYTYRPGAPDNNVIMTVKYLNDNGVFTIDNGATNLKVASLDVVDGKHVVTLSVDPLASGQTYNVTMLANFLQIGQTNTKLLDANKVETYEAYDVVAPKLVSDVDGKPLASSYLPNNGSTVAKTETLALEFTEPVVGAGVAEIHRFDGVLVATINLAGKESKTDLGGALNGRNILQLAKVSDLMGASNPELVTGKLYYVIIPNGAVVDKAATPNKYAGINAVNEWKFDLRDDANPIVDFADNNKIDLAVNTPIRLTFDRKVQNGAGFLAIYTEDGNAVQLIRTPASVDASKLTATIYPNVLKSNTKYLVEVGDDTYRLDVDNTIPSKAVKGQWSFTTEMNDAPTIAVYSPAKAKTNVELSSDLVITFDQPVVAGMGNIQLHKKQTTGGPIITNYNVTDATKVIISGKTVTIPSAALGLTENSEYYVIIPSTAIRNASPTVEYFAGVVVPFEWSFSTIADRTAPTVVAAASAQTGLGDNKTKFDVTLTFNEDVNYVNAASVTATNATIALTEVTAKRVYNVAVTAADLANVKISLSDSIKDQLNNRLVPVSFDYKVADNNKPLVAASTEATTFSNSIFDVKLTFNEIVKNVASSLSVNGGAKILSVSPDSGAVYTVKVDATTATATVLAISKEVVDLAGNKFDGAAFTYGTAKVPTVVALTPRDGSGIDADKLKEAAKKNPVLSIEFSENVVSAGNPNLFVSLYKMKEDGTVLGKVFQSTVPADFSGRILNIPVLVDLEDEVNYVALVDAGIVKSDFGLAFAGILNPTSWNFKAGDNTAPVLTITNDQVAPLNAKSNINLTLTFADKSGIVDGVAAAVKVVGASNTPVPVKVNNLKYTLALEAADYADVVVTVDSTITDKDGRNTLVAPQVVTFKVGDNTAPTVAISGTVVKNTIAATLTFSEVVKNVTDVTVTATNIIGKPVIAAADTTGKVYTATMEAADNATVVLTATAAIVDNNNNKLVANSAEFKVNDNTAPVAVYTASKLSSNFVVDIAFDEVVNGVDSAITVVGGTFELLQPVGNTYPVAITATAATVTLNVSDKIKDASGNAYAGASKTYFTTAAASVTPASGTAGLTNTFDVLVTFNDGVVVPSDGVFSVSSNATASKALALVGNKYQITITAKDLEVVTLTISDAVKDAMGNSFAAAEYVYTIGDNSAPYVVVGGYSPADGDFDVKNPLSLVLTFNENIVAGATASKVKVYEQTVSNKNQLVFETSINSDMIEGNVLTIPVAYRLIDNTAYTVTIDNAIVKDSSNNSFKDGFVDPTRWNFSTGDNTAPVVVSVTPETATAAKNIFDVTVVFTKDVVRVAENITAKNGEVVSVKGAGKTWVATISAADGAVVDVTIGTGVIDAALRNTLATAVTKTYTVGDNTAPTLVVTDPKAPVAATFTVGLAFSEVVTGVVADAIVVSNGTIKSVAGAGKDYILTIVAAEEAVVGISIPNTIADATGNKFAGQTLEYTVGDFTAPVVAGVVSGEGHDVKVVLTFSTDAIVAEGDITVEGADSDATITNVDNVYTINTTIADKSTVVVSVSPDVVDEAGNKIAGILDFSKTIGDITAPTVMIDPVAAKDTLNQFDVTLVFSESVQNVFDAISVNAPATAVVESYLNHTVFKVTITAPDLATVNMVITDAIVDGAGNKYEGGTFTYTIGDHSSPTVTGVSTVTGNDVKVVLTFSEDAIVTSSDITVTGATSSNVTNVGNVYTVTAKANDLATVVVKVSEAIVDVDGNKITGTTTFTNTIVDNTKPVVSVVAATINNVDGTASITSSEVSAVYLVDATVALTKDAVIAALAAKKAVAGYAAVANQAVVVSAAGLVPGSYQAVAIDASGNVGVSTQKVVVEAVPVYQVVTIAKIQGTGANSPLANETVVTSGVVTGVDAAKKGFFMQDASKAWSGIYVADATLAAQVNIGTGVKVTGKVAESNGLTQIGNVIASEFVALGLDIVPVAVTTDKAAVEQYESVYVIFAAGDNGIATAVDANKEWTIKTNAGTTVKIDDQLFAYSPKAGMRYAVDGIVNYTSGEFKVAPRNISDIEDLTSAPELSSEFKVYPTLFDNVINIKSTSELRLTKAVFTNIAGQVVKEVINPESVITTSELRSGYYFISLHTENGVVKTERICKR
jgi:hypothetical protein